MRIFHAAFSCAGVAMQLMLPCVAQAANISIPLLPVTSIITIQPIDVCDAIGTDCASLANLANDETAVNAVWDQAGLGFDFLPAVQFDDTTSSQGFLNPTVTIAAGFPTGTPTDLAHQLMYGPGHGQSSNPTTLNVWFVDHLTRSDGVGIYGTAFIGGNGVIIPTLPNLNTGQLPALDTLAHEVGHNLGLQHVDGTSSSSPLNLMQSVGRTVPSNFCQVNPNTCILSVLPRTGCCRHRSRLPGIRFSPLIWRKSPPRSITRRVSVPSGPKPATSLSISPAQRPLSR